MFSRRWSTRIVPFLSICLIVAGSLTIGASKASAVSPGPLVYAVNPYSNEAHGDERGLQPFDAFTGDSIGGHQIVIVAGPIPGIVEGATGLSVDPLTSTAYAILRVNGFEQPRVLATIDLTNGQATTLGDTGLRLAGLAHNSAGDLYAVSGGGGSPSACKGCLYKLNESNGQPDPAPKQMGSCTTFGSGDCGHALAYDVDDGRFYHATGAEEAVPTFERTGPTLADPMEQIGLSGDEPEQLLGLGYDAPNDRFIATDRDTQVFSITPAGLTTQLPDTRWYKKGVVVSSDPVPTDIPPAAVNDVATTQENASIPIAVFDNDTNPDGGPEFIDSFTQPTNGEVRDNGNTLNYIPRPGYCNDGGPTDDFTYTLNGGSTATVSVTVTCQPFEGPLVFGVQSFGNGTSAGDGGIQAFDAGSGRIEFEALITAQFGSAITGPVTGAVALAVNPRSGVAYALLRMDTAPDDLVLATIDPLTGDATTIAKTRNTLTGMTFSSKGTLYAIADDNDVACPSCLFVMNRSNGALKNVRRLSPSFQSGIAFNPADGKIYRATDDKFQSIDPARRYAVRSIGYGGLDPNDVIGMGYDTSSGGFILTDESNDVWLVSTNGGAIQLSDIDLNLSGLVVSEPTLTLGYSSKRRVFSGKLLTPALMPCDGNRTISVWRVADGPDVFIGDATTGANGAFSLVQRAGRGLYYADTPDGPPTNELPCPDATSRMRRIR